MAAHVAPVREIVVPASGLASGRKLVIVAGAGVSMSSTTSGDTTTLTISADVEGGAVFSVNGETGDVELDAEDVGADPAGTGASESAAAVAAHEADPDPHPDYALESSLGTAAAEDRTSAILWSPDVTPAGLLSGYERGDGTGGLTAWNPSGTVTMTEVPFGLVVYGTAGQHGGPRWAVPAATQWSVTTYVVLYATNASNRYGGIWIAEDVVANPTTANLYGIVFEFDASGRGNVKVQTWTAYNAFVSTVASVSDVGYQGSIYLRVSSDGTNLTTSISQDGIGWLEIDVGRSMTAHLAAGILYHGVIGGGTSSEPSIYAWVRRRSGASEYRTTRIEGGPFRGIAV